MSRVFCLVAALFFIISCSRLASLPSTVQRDRCPPLCSSFAILPVETACIEMFSEPILNYKHFRILIRYYIKIGTERSVSVGAHFDGCRWNVLEISDVKRWAVIIHSRLIIIWSVFRFFVYIPLSDFPCSIIFLAFRSCRNSFFPIHRSCSPSLMRHIWKTLSENTKRASVLCMLRISPFFHSLVIYFSAEWY